MTNLTARPATAIDILALTPREPGGEADPGLTAAGLAANGHETFAIEAAGRVIAILALWEWRPGVALGWGSISHDATRREMHSLSVAIRHYLKQRGLRRIEATAARGFDAGHRWLEYLDFKAEGLMPCYGPDGATHIRYGLTFPENT